MPPWLKRRFSEFPGLALFEKPLKFYFDMKNMIKFILAALLTTALLAVSGCNTFKGMGEDFEAMGESMQKAGD